MKLAVFSDVHANMPACQALLNDMPSVDAMLCAGDLVGYYPDANQVCDALRMLGAQTVRGNHDAYVLGELQPDGEKRVTYRTDWTAAHLSSVNLAWLRALPVRLVFRWDTITVILEHASPWDETTYLYPDSARLEDVVACRDEILVFGHTHYPMQIVTAQGGLVLNPGSVGQPRDRDPRVSYAVVDTRTREVEIRRVEYDVSSLQSRLRDCGWESSTIDILSRRR